jgi:NIMA (never in mitosis gene a)-related kinase
VMDFADGGDLAKLITDQKGRYFSESQIMDWFTQICLGIKHVHDRKILHRDIKSQNVFVTKQNIIKIGDFGIARVLRHTVDVSRSMVGTPYYLSPEIIEGKPYSFKSDIWSLGVMLYELCALKPPFEGMNLHFLALKIIRGEYAPLPAHFSRELKTLVSQMLTMDVSRRPHINQILK